MTPVDEQVKRTGRALGLDLEFDCFNRSAKWEAARETWDECYATAGQPVFLDGFGAKAYLTVLQTSVADTGLTVTFPIAEVTAIEATSVEYPTYLPSKE